MSKDPKTAFIQVLKGVIASLTSNHHRLGTKHGLKRQEIFGALARVNDAIVAARKQGALHELPEGVPAFSQNELTLIYNLIRSYHQLQQYALIPELFFTQLGNRGVPKEIIEGIAQQLLEVETQAQ